MILTCPACETRYRIDDAALADPAGRELRCAKCGHEWRYVPTPAAPPTPAPPPATVPPPLVTPATAEAAPVSRAGPPPAVARGSGVGVGCLLVLVLIAALIAAAVLVRTTIVAAFPPLGRVYSAVGLRPEPLGTGLQIGKVAPSRNGDVLVVEGEVTNTTGASHALPRLRVVLRDAAGKELTGKVIDPPAATLAAGATAHFRTEFDHPSDTATGVAVTFAAK